MTEGAWDLLLLLTLPLAGAIVVAVLPRRHERAALPVATAVAALTLLVALWSVVRGHRDGWDVVHGERFTWVDELDLAFAVGVDGISAPLVVLTALLVLLCAAYSVRHLPAPGRPRAFAALLLLLELGMLGTFLALDLVLFFVAFETVLVPMWLLIGVWGGPGRRAAATKFVLYTLAGSVLLLVGLLTVLLGAGTADVLSLTAGHGLSRGTQLFAFVLLAVGFAVKTPLWPLHTWLPHAHTEAPTVGSVLLAGVLLKMGVYGFVRIAVPVLPDAARAAAPYLAVFAAVAVVYGALCCLAQRDLKRLIAYSSIGHMGFVMLGVATLTPVGLNAALFASVAHGVVTGLLFFLAGAVKDRFHTGQLREIGGGLGVKLPVVGGLLAFAAIASLGMPGLAGFWGEMLALYGAWSPAAGPRPAFVVAMVVAALGAVLTAAYFLWLLHRLIFGIVAPRWRAAPLGDAGAAELGAWAPLVLLTGLLGVWPRLLLDVTTPAVSALLGGAP